PRLLVKNRRWRIDGRIQPISVPTCPSDPVLDLGACSLRQCSLCGRRLNQREELPDLLTPAPGGQCRFQLLYAAVLLFEQSLPLCSSPLLFLPLAMPLF